MIMNKLEPPEAVNDKMIWVSATGSLPAVVDMVNNKRPSRQCENTSRV
jgi:hypothetical protein